MRSLTLRLACIVGPLLLSTASPVAAQVLRLAELNTEQIRALDRRTTVVVIPGGILEEHGPYLPSYTDGFFNERIAGDLAAAIARRPGWTAVVFPSIPLGVAGANVIGRHGSFPGSYPVRAATLRAVFMDLGTELGEQGFRWIFVVHAHGGVPHSRALDEAGDYFRDTYGGRMVHLFGVQLPLAADSVLRAAVPRAALDEDGATVHAGLGETSRVMALRPDLVPPSVARAPSLTGRDFADLVRIASRPDWPGYFGAPRHASAELGRRVVEAASAQFVGLALRILDGMDERQLPRFADQRAGVPGPAAIAAFAYARDSTEEARQRAWLEKRPRP